MYRTMAGRFFVIGLFLGVAYIVREGRWFHPWEQVAGVLLYGVYVCALGLIFLGLARLAGYRPDLSGRLRRVRPPAEP